jgi:FAD-linked oxidoreductase
MRGRAGTGWSNWAGNQSCAPAAVARPRDVDEVARAVAAAAARGQRVKAVGSGHSFTGVALTDGLLVDLADLQRPVTVDGDLVTVPGGMPLHRLNDVLAQHGRALSNLGDIDRQTIAGALSTGTHGTGARYGGLAAQVAALELVHADGSVVTYSAGTDEFDAARVGLGSLGVVTAVSLRTEPAYELHALEAAMRLDEVLDGLDDLVASNDHFEFYWWPHTDRTLTKSNNRVPSGTPPQPLPRWRAWVEDELLSNGLFGVTCRLGRRVPAVVPLINQVAGRAQGHREFVQPSYRVFCSARRVRFVEMEYAVPRAAARVVVSELDRLVRRAGLRVSFPVEVRFAPADDAWLSTAFERDSAYVAVHLFQGVDEPGYFRGFEAIADAVDGRPHWGKLHFQSHETLRPRYRRFGDFVAVRDRLDPGGVFSNDYLDRVLGPVGGR